MLALGVEKLKDSGFSGLAVPEAPGSDVNPPVPPPSQFALAATRYFHEYGIPFEEGKQTLAQIASKNHHNGTMSPKAHFQREVSAEQVANAPMVAWPLGLFDCCGVSDGAAAAIITTPEIAKTFRDDYILVKGIGLSVGAFGIMRNDWELHSLPRVGCAPARPPTRRPASAIPAAKSTWPWSTIASPSPSSSFMRDLGFSPRGRASADVEAGTFTLGRATSRSTTDGGLKCFGHPIGASGIRMIYEVYKQLQGRAGDRQLQKADLGLTHNLGGRPGSFTCSVALFGTRD